MLQKRFVSTPERIVYVQGMAFWYCLKHHAVEPVEGCPNKDRLGPYETEAEAARALEKAAERTEAWDEDPVWNDDVEDK